jgi:hypothetical protein
MSQPSPYNPAAGAASLPFPTGTFTLLVYPSTTPRTGLETACTTMYLSAPGAGTVIQIGSGMSSVTYTSNVPNFGHVVCGASGLAINAGSVTYTFQSLLIAQLPQTNRILLFGRVDVSLTNGSGARFVAILQTAQTNTPPASVPGTWNVAFSSTPGTTIATISLFANGAYSPTVTFPGNPNSVTPTINWQTGQISWSDPSGTPFSGILYLDHGLGSGAPSTINWRFEGTVQQVGGTPGDWVAQGGDDPQ